MGGNKTEAILTFIEDFVEKNHFSPTVREIREGLDFSSTSVVEYHLRKLEQAGDITRAKHKARSIVLKED